MRILALEAANIKRIKAIQIVPTGPLVKLAGKNKQGKTSILDSIMWVLGGAGTIQAVPIRQGEKEGVIRVTLGDKEAELLVERKITEKGEYLKLRNADGSRPAGGDQAILNKIIGKLTFDPVAFMREAPAKQLETLRGLVTLADEDGKPLDLIALDAQSKAAYTDRTDHNRDHKSTLARAEGIAVPTDLPDQAPSVNALLDEMGEVASFNIDLEKEKARRAARVEAMAQETKHIPRVMAEIVSLEDQLADARERYKNTVAAEAAIAAEIAALPALPEPKDTADIQAKIEEARRIDAAIIQRRTKAELVAEAQTYKELADQKTAIIEANDWLKTNAVSRAKMPVAGLGFGETGVLFNSLPLDQASDAEQLQVSVAIAAALNPKLRVMRVRDGSILDSVAMAGLEAFGAENDYQIWIEIVDESGEVGLTIEDGGVRGQEITPEALLGPSKIDAPATGTAASAAQEPPNEERQKAADAYLASVLEELATIRKDAPDGAAQVAALHGKVKAKLKHFPDLIGEQWNPAKLEKEGSLKPRRAAE